MVGQEYVVDVGPVAHGGHFVARIPEAEAGADSHGGGRVVFVRHALPGEQVRVRVTEGDEGSRFLRADAVRVLSASPHRVDPPCPYAATEAETRCGGCDFQHVAVPHQRELKAAVVREQFARLAGMEVDVTVEQLPGDPDEPDGLRWRSRVEFAVDAAGRAGLHPHRSHAVIPVDDCLIASRRVVDSGVLGVQWTGCTGVDVVAADEPPAAVVVPLPVTAKVPYVVQRVTTPSWSDELAVSARGFWQVHPAAAATFVGHVLAELAPQSGERVVDLYAGAGLFALALADAVGPDGAVLAVESSAAAVRDGEANAAEAPTVEFRHNRVDRALKPLLRKGIRADLVVLDPPRTGAGRSVVADLAALGPRAVAYVACDPAALARDTSYLRNHGYRLRSLRAFDAFPMTHHVECIAVFDR